MSNKEKSEAIVAALHSVESGQEVFDALCEVPTDNLIDMSRMILAIIQERIDHHFKENH